jgi:hypothetical protein
MEHALIGLFLGKKSEKKRMRRILGLGVQGNLIKNCLRCFKIKSKEEKS